MSSGLVTKSSLLPIQFLDKSTSERTNLKLALPDVLRHGPIRSPHSRSVSGATRKRLRPAIWGDSLLGTLSVRSANQPRSTALATRSLSSRCLSPGPISQLARSVLMGCCAGVIGEGSAAKPRYCSMDRACGAMGPGDKHRDDIGGCGTAVSAATPSSAPHPVGSITSPPSPTATSPPAPECPPVSGPATSTSAETDPTRAGNPPARRNRSGRL